jgi:hypothetical protein
MTSCSPSKCSSDVHQHNERKDGCGVSMTIDEIHVEAEQPADAADEGRYNFAQMQFLHPMAAIRPTTFDCKLSGWMSAPRTKFILQRAMFEKLPLLMDISNSTSTEQQATAHLQLPCSMKGFMSLLLVLEGHMKLRQLIQGDIDTSLPTQTLLVRSSGCICNRIELSIHLTHKVVGRQHPLTVNRCA